MTFPPVKSNAELIKTDWTCFFSNIGVLQTTVAELITVKEHQRESRPLSGTAHSQSGNG